MILSNNNNNNKNQQQQQQTTNNNNNKPLFQVVPTSPLPLLMAPAATALLGPSFGLLQACRKIFEMLFHCLLATALLSFHAFPFPLPGEQHKSNFSSTYVRAAADDWRRHPWVPPGVDTQVKLQISSTLFSVSIPKTLCAVLKHLTIVQPL